MENPLHNQVEGIDERFENSNSERNAGNRESTVNVSSKGDLEYSSTIDKKTLRLSLKVSPKGIENLSLSDEKELKLNIHFNGNDRWANSDIDGLGQGNQGVNITPILFRFSNAYCPCGCGCRFVNFPWGTILIDPRTNLPCGHH